MLTENIYVRAFVPHFSLAMVSVKELKRARAERQILYLATAGTGKLDTVVPAVPDARAAMVEQYQAAGTLCGQRRVFVSIRVFANGTWVPSLNPVSSCAQSTQSPRT